MNWTCSLVNEIIIKFPVIANETLWEKLNNSIVRPLHSNIENASHTDSQIKD